MSPRFGPGDKRCSIYATYRPARASGVSGRSLRALMGPTVLPSILAREEGLGFDFAPAKPGRLMVYSFRYLRMTLRLCGEQALLDDRLFHPLVLSTDGTIRFKNPPITLVYVGSVKQNGTEQAERQRLLCSPLRIAEIMFDLLQGGCSLGSWPLCRHRLTRTSGKRCWAAKTSGSHQCSSW